MKKKTRAQRGWMIALAAMILLLVGAAFFAARNWQALVAYFRHGIVTLHSPMDRDADGVDDWTDLMRGARAYVSTQPVYKSEYYAGGYPPEGEGVCTDVIWRAMQAAGYDLKAMVDADIAAHRELYPLENGMSDSNIDFRRVVNLQVFFERHFESLTLDMSEVEQWQPGDLVVFEGHVAVVSDRRNQQGRPYIIHHASYGACEEDRLDYKTIVGHYRLSGEILLQQ